MKKEFESRIQIEREIVAIVNAKFPHPALASVSPGAIKVWTDQHCSNAAALRASTVLAELSQIIVDWTHQSGSPLDWPSGDMGTKLAELITQLRRHI